MSEGQLSDNFDVLCQHGGGGICQSCDEAQVFVNDWNTVSFFDHRLARYWEKQLLRSLAIKPVFAHVYFDYCVFWSLNLVRLEVCM